VSLEHHDDEHVNIQPDVLLHIHLNEYRKLKDEQIARIVMREHLVYVTLGVFGGVSSYTLHDSHYYAFLVIPWVCVILGWMYLITDEKVSAIGEYIRKDLTEKLAPLADTKPALLLGWEVAHRSDQHRFLRKLLQLLVDEVTFVLSGLFALAAFWWFQTEWTLLFQITWWIEGFFLLLLGIWILITADLGIGR
jgi:hypothetical protein